MWTDTRKKEYAKNIKKYKFRYRARERKFGSDTRLQNQRIENS